MSELQPENTANTSKAVGKQSSLSMDRAAFLLIRIKRVFQKKKQKRYKLILWEMDPLMPSFPPFKEVLNLADFNKKVN